VKNLLAVIRRELAAGQVKGVAELVQLGWLAPGASNGNPLAHVVAGVSGGSAPPPVPYPDPENNPNGSSSGSGGSGGAGNGSGGGFSSSNGDDAGSLRGGVRGPLNPNVFLPNPG
jgi:hypothetical protein